MIALITGITGQDGSYLTEALLRRGDVVHGTVRRTSTLERSRLAHLYADSAIHNKQLFLHYAGLEDSSALRGITDRVKPQQFYHLAGQSHVGLSFEMPETTCEITAIGTLRILEVLRDSASPKFLHASSSEIFGSPDVSPQTENTAMRPVNPLWVRQGLHHADGANLSRPSWSFRLQRHFLQPRISSPKGELCHAEDLSRRCRD